jgi:hypothetical protein
MTPSPRAPAMDSISRAEASETPRDFGVRPAQSRRAPCAESGDLDGGNARDRARQLRSPLCAKRRAALGSCNPLLGTTRCLAAHQARDRAASRKAGGLVDHIRRA